MKKERKRMEEIDFESSVKVGKFCLYTRAFNAPQVLACINDTLNTSPPQWLYTCRFVLVNPSKVPSYSLSLKNVAILILYLWIQLFLISVLLNSILDESILPPYK